MQSVLLAILVIVRGSAGVTTAAPPPDPVLDRFDLSLPLVCQIGETCWVANYVDVDPSDGAHDFRCQPRTYNTHDGIDFAIRDYAVMQQGVPVVASAPGVVRRVREGVEDVVLNEEAPPARIAGRKCGNGMIIDHGGGWQTQCCHLRRSSVRVKVGEQVERGTVLGLVGLSGKTKFPHVHLAVRYNGQIVDPFTGQLMSAGCGLIGNPLWREGARVSYEEAALYNAGFSSGSPEVGAIRSGKQSRASLSATSPALVMWVDIFGAQTGDHIRFRIVGPNGQLVLDHEERVDRTQARRFSFVGQRLQSSAWASGAYLGEVTLMRNLGGQTTERRLTRTITIR